MDEAKSPLQECCNTTVSDVADYLDSSQKVCEEEEKATALTLMYRNKLSVCVHWLHGTHRAQWQDFLCASGPLDGQLHLHIRQACSGDKCKNTETSAYLESSEKWRRLGAKH